MNRDFSSGEWSVPIELAREADFELGQLHVRPSLCELRCDARTETLEPRVMQALVGLASRKGAVVSRDELVQRCWNGLAVGDDAINRCIGKVRKLADLDGGRSFRIDTVPRVGYRLIEIRNEGENTKQETLGRATHEATKPNTLTIARWPLRWTVAGAAVLLILGMTYFLLRAPGPVARAGDGQDLITIHPQSASSLPPGAIFKDCARNCPEMVIIPASYFNMGSANPSTADSLTAKIGPYDNELPQHEVLISKPFAVARYDVTREEFAAFASDTHRPEDKSCHTLTRSGLFVETVGANWRHPGFAQTERDPVVCIDWPEAVAYTNWLAQKTGRPYRLLSEAEWEYSARAGSDNARLAAADGLCSLLNGGDADYHARFSGDKNVDVSCHDGFVATSPVGHFPANAFGLFDMQGNVWQWVADCYHGSYDGAPLDGSPWIEGDCSQRIVRGGAWTDDTRNIRFASRGGGDFNARYSSNGFRVARSLQN